MTDISRAIHRAVHSNHRFEGPRFIDAGEARSLTYRAGGSPLANSQLRRLRNDIASGYVRADYRAVEVIDRHLYSFDRYRPSYRPAPTRPMPPPPRCERTAGGVARDAVVGGLLGAIVGGVIAGDDGAAVGGAIGGVAGATRPCDY